MVGAGEVGELAELLDDIALDAPAAGLQKAPLEVLEAIAMRVERLGIPAQVSG